MSVNHFQNDTASKISASLFLAGLRKALQSVNKTLARSEYRQIPKDKSQRPQVLVVAAG
jgi:hypothetical protein